MGCKLLILADDFTGALDTAASLARSGIPVLAVTDLFMAPASVDIPVLVMDTESRHLEPAEAYNVYEIITEPEASNVSAPSGIAHVSGAEGAAKVRVVPLPEVSAVCSA